MDLMWTVTELKTTEHIGQTWTDYLVTLKILLNSNNIFKDTVK